MIIDSNLLLRFNPCEEELQMFKYEYPHGLDVSWLWSNNDKRRKEWKRVLSIPLLRRNLGWAIYKGIIPGVISGDFSGMDLRHLYLSHASIIRSDFSDANLMWSRINHCNMNSVTLDNVNLRCAEFRYSIFRNSRVRNARMPSVCITDSAIRNSVLEKIQIENGVVCRLMISQCDIQSVSLQDDTISDSIIVVKD